MVSGSCDCGASTPGRLLTLATNRLLTGSADGEVRKFDFFSSLRGRAPISSAQRAQMSGLPESVNKGLFLLSSWENKGVDSQSNRKPCSTLPDRRESSHAIQIFSGSPVFSMELQSQGLWMLAGCQDGSMNLATLRHDEGDCKATLQKHSDVVSAMQLHRNERHCFTGSWDRTIVDWDLDTGQDVRTLGPGRGQITSLKLQPSSSGEGNLLLSSSIDGNVIVWDARTPDGEAISFSVPEKTPPWAMSATWSTDGTRVYCGRREAAVDEWDVRNPGQTRRFALPKSSGPVYSVACMANDKQLLW
jgi:transcriptional activator SPT8